MTCTSAIACACGRARKCPWTAQSPRPTHVDESMLTGEPMPVGEGAGDAVIGGTVNTHRHIPDDGRARSAARRCSRGSSRWSRKRSAAARPVQKLADRVAAWFVPVVVLVAVITFVVWWLFGPAPTSRHRAR